MHLFVLSLLCVDLQCDTSRWFVCLLLIKVSGGQVKGRAWLFVGQCWLAAGKSDGRVERRLRVCTQGIGFAKVESSHTNVNTQIQKTPLYNTLNEGHVYNVL